LGYFELNELCKEPDSFHLDLEEINNPPEEHRSEKLLSKSFYPTITIQDFPIRGPKMFMYINRRRLIARIEQKMVRKMYSQVALPF
jgi:hypothetical protein